MAIQPIQSMQMVLPSQSVAKTTPSDFSEVLSQAMNGLNDAQQASSQARVDLATGKTTDLHNIMIKTEEASLSMQLAIEVRNKGIEAYQEMMRMQL
ncbi:MULTISPECIES: flagellar hook-basal body complex protein FliE [Exiguobacterium]|uniref:Flagellar hook-basal body complex protein FliE n=2 Tax=Exiguobacterium TaxID=33986 RepID=B1YIA5_EXIS2|nr:MULTISPECIES: flagellar hook-basal body complex protein FliE [Exiguobacterium]ACB61332.1 flagellar hook-basal body complex subunit FliE [Exiguobacterium sibiricum 255-15]AFS70839.1 Flagellar hook-basal body complex protein FliE [Exiguobacterium antarcticum B7]MCT4781098.1 flagellar hook-basal body complex protein FliE [Exiguobacterium soli]MDI3233848.1 flagellar hook-basal body complex protein FliE [Exiguobacterium antarcticum]MDX1258584.1 flagellar hook-basal body complex protein FliE [Exi